MLTHQQICKTHKPGRYFDGRNGLHILIRNKDHKSWVLRFTAQGRRREMGLGSFPEVGLAEARKKVEEARAALKKGIDPIEARKAAAMTTERSPETAPVTFRDFATDWIGNRKAEWRNGKHSDQWISTLERYVFPVIGDLPPAEINTEHVLAILQPIWTTKPETASRVRGRVERILAAATTRHFRQGMNPALWRGHLDTLLSASSRIKKVRHHPAVDYQSMPAFMAEVGHRPGVATLALQFTILTACRTSEVILGRRDEVRDDVWVIPGERMKAGREHRVPLNEGMQDLLARSAELDPDSPYLFSRHGRPLSNMAMLELVRSIEPGKTVHGFRSTFRDWVSEDTAFSPEIAEMALAHVIANKVEAAYRRGNLLEKRRQLMDAWASYCSGGSTIVPFRIVTA
jgi:integrase